MERPILKYQRKSGVKYTLVLNFASIAKSLKRTPSLLCRFLTLKLESCSCHVCKDGRLVISHKLGQRYLSDIFAEFAQHFVVCPNCFTNNTSLTVENPAGEGKQLKLTCEKCEGPSSSIVVSHKFAGHIIRQIRMEEERARPRPEPIIVLKDESEMESETEIEPTTVGLSVPTVSDNAMAADSSKAVWLLSVERLREFASRKSIPTDDLILDFAQDLLYDMDLSTIELVPLLWSAFVDQASHYRAAILRRANLFRDTIDLLVPYDGSLIFLGCIESSILSSESEGILDHKIHAVPRIIKSLLDTGVIDADTALGWFDGSVQSVRTSMMVQTPLSQNVRDRILERCVKMIKWLSDDNANQSLPKKRLTTDTMDFEYVKLDLVKPGFKPPKPNESNNKRMVLPSAEIYEWSEIDDNSIGNDWTFLEDAL